MSRATDTLVIDPSQKPFAASAEIVITPVQGWSTTVTTRRPKLHQYVCRSDECVLKFSGALARNSGQWKIAYQLLLEGLLSTAPQQEQQK
jgi:hypothetical protein